MNKHPTEQTPTLRLRVDSIPFNKTLLKGLRAQTDIRRGAVQDSSTDRNEFFRNRIVCCRKINRRKIAGQWMGAGGTAGDGGEPKCTVVDC